MSGSRALWPSLVLVPLVLVATAKRVSARVAGRVAAVFVIVVAAASLGPPGQRIIDGINDLALVESGNYSTSLGKRLVMWQVGVDAAAERPWLGHGLEAPRRLMRERTAAVGGAAFHYSHFHNFLINEWVRAGAFGVAALLAMFVVPLWAVWRNRRRDETALAAFQLLASIQIVFLASGLFNIMLDHDIVDALFVAATALALYLSFGSKATSTGDAVPES